MQGQATYTKADGTRVQGSPPAPVLCSIVFLPPFASLSLSFFSRASSPMYVQARLRGGSSSWPTASEEGQAAFRSLASEHSVDCSLFITGLCFIHLCTACLAAANWMPVVELWNLANAHTISRVQHPKSNVAAASLNYKPFVFFCRSCHRSLH
jgi:hypothetical protein